MTFAFRGTIVDKDDAPILGLFVEVLGANDQYERARLATATTDDAGRFEVSCRLIDSGYNVGLVVVYSDFEELFGKRALEIDGWRNLDLRIVLSDGERVEDPYRGPEERMALNFIAATLDIVDWNKVDPSRQCDKTLDFLQDWRDCAGPNAPAREGFPKTKLPERPYKEPHSHDC